MNLEIRSMSEASNSGRVKRIQYVRGFPFLDVAWFTKKNIEDSIDYEPQDGDTILASYPKTGTTWLQYIVEQIVSNGESFPLCDELFYNIQPYIEITGISVLETLRKPRIYKHHLPYNLVRKNPKTKYVYIYRNPDDTVVSYYHFMQSILDESIDFDDFFEDFLSGSIIYGSYFDHLLSYESHQSEGNILMVSYESLHENRKGEILKIARFLDEEYFNNIKNDEKVLSTIYEKTSFDYMKKKLYFTNPDPDQITGEKPKKVAMFRKGVVGDGKATLSSDQLRRLKEVTAQKTKGTRFFDEWLNTA